MTRPVHSVAALLVSAGAAAAFQPCHDQWSPIGGGLPGIDSDAVDVLAVFDDGSGAALYAGGSFRIEHGAPANGLARWDGSAWSDVGGSLSGDPKERIYDLCTFDDGTGPALYVVGPFLSIGGVPARRSAKWDGATWSEVGGGVASLYPGELQVVDTGGGPELFVAGWFSEAGGHQVQNVARLADGLWAPVGDGIKGSDDQFGCVYFPLIEDLEAYDDGTGPALYACGRFEYSADIEAVSIVRWDGQAWSALGPDGGPLHAGTACTAMASHDNGAGAALYLGSWCGDNIPLRRWNGLNWANVSGAPDTPNVLLSHDDGHGPSLFIGGKFAEAGGKAASSVARWSDGAWTGLGGGVTASDGAPGIVRSMLSDPFEPGGLIVAGRFAYAGGIPSNNIARWACRPCPADCDHSGSIDVLDYMCFVALFNAADPAADCDASGALDLFDFLCFVNAFNAGC